MDVTYKILDPPRLLRTSETLSCLSTKHEVALPDITKLLFVNMIVGKQCLQNALINQNEDSKSNDYPIPPPTLQTTAFDWIGLYPAEFSDLELDYITYVYTSSSVSMKHHRNDYSTSALIYPQSNLNDVRYKTKIDAKYLKKFNGQSFCLIYMSRNKNCPQGYSPVFKVNLLLFKDKIIKILNYLFIVCYFLLINRIINRKKIFYNEKINIKYFLICIFYSG